MIRLDFCTPVFPSEYDFIAQAEEVIKAANKYHQNIHDECPPPYFPLDVGKFYGLVVEVSNLRAQLAEAREIIEVLAKRNDEFIFIVGGMATIDFNVLRNAAAYLKNYPKE